MDENVADPSPSVPPPLTLPFLPYPDDMHQTTTKEMVPATAGMPIMTGPSARVGKNPGLKKKKPAQWVFLGFFGFFGFFWVFWGFLGCFAQTRGFLGYFLVSRILLGASRL